MTYEDLNTICDKIDALIIEKPYIDDYNRGFVDGLYHALRVCALIYFGEVEDNANE